MNRVNLFTTEELIYIKQFFEGIDFEVSRLLSDTPDTPEESLTFMLGQFLDSKTNIHQKLLSYTLSDLNKDLYGSRKRIDITFDTHEHKRHYEGKSKADMGIILEMKDYDGKKIKKGLLIQCKKLKYDHRFNLRSKYGLDQNVKVNGKKIDQLKYIRNKERIKGVKYYYLFYNPLFRSFEEKKDRIEILDFENYDDCVHIRPGIKATDTNFIKNIRKVVDKKTFTLGDAYVENQKNLSSFFVSFSMFIEHFLNCNIGLKDFENQEYLNICSGYGEKDTVKHTLNLKISDVESKQCNEHMNNLES